MLWVRISIKTRCTALCDKACTWLATGRWFSPGLPVSSTNKTISHDIAEIVLKVALNNIKQTSNYLSYQSFAFERTWWRLFQKHVMRIKVDIYIFIDQDINMQTGLHIIFDNLPFLQYLNAFTVYSIHNMPTTMYMYNII
jgi:hypothetical protein